MRKGKGKIRNIALHVGHAKAMRVPPSPMCLSHMLDDADPID